MKGVAVLTRKSPWLANREIFIKNGFEVVDTAPPDYELLVNKFDPSESNPRFKGNWDKKLKKYGQKLVIIRSDQCPHIMKFADEIAEMAEKIYGLHSKFVELKTHQEAQNAPTPYAVFSIIYKGVVIADHQVSKSRFKNIMNKLIS